jgi:8-oxo-dGTP pyrophosphatase MutT (NUDIX family)
VTAGSCSHDAGSSPRSGSGIDGLRREFLEETGLDVRPLEWVGAFVDPYLDRTVLGLSWLVTAEGEPRAADDVDELAWFGPNELPAQMAFPHQDVVLERWRASVAAGRT